MSIAGCYRTGQDFRKCPCSCGILYILDDFVVVVMTLLYTLVVMMVTVSENI